MTSEDSGQELQARNAELQSENTELQARNAELQARNTELQVESAANAKSKGRKAVEKKDKKAVSDGIIHLNVGGEKLTTEKSTLCQVKGSKLAKMFSDKRKDSLKYDEDGAVLLDYNPEHFKLILDYLREKKMAASGKLIPAPKVAEDQLQSFSSILQNLGLSDEILVTDAASSEKFGQHSKRRNGGAKVEENGTVAINDQEGEAHNYFLGENVYQHGMNVKLKLESFENNDWMFVGIVKADVVPPAKTDSNHTYSQKWSGSYGWAFGEKFGTKWQDGTGKDKTDLRKIAKRGDKIQLVLNCNAPKPKVSLYFPAGKAFHIEIPKSESWRLNVNLRGKHDKIRIMNE